MHKCRNRGGLGGHAPPIKLSQIGHSNTHMHTLGHVRFASRFTLAIIIDMSESSDQLSPLVAKISKAFGMVWSCDSTKSTNKPVAGPSRDSYSETPSTSSATCCDSDSDYAEKELEQSSSGIEVAGCSADWCKLDFARPYDYQPTNTAYHT